jgi:hypothetical protein
METAKEVVSLVGAIFGLLTVLVPLIARLVDRNKQVARVEQESVVQARIPCGRLLTVVPAGAAVEDEPESYYEPRPPDSRQLQRARALVKAPATALLVAGLLGLVFNLFVAAFGYVDEFVTPLSMQSQERHKAAATPQADRPAGDKSARSSEQERSTTVLAIVALLGFAAACGMAAWAGFHMMRLRSYWLSVAGSCAIMPGACFCFLARLPVGIWSLTVLFRPEVRSSFS